MAEIHRYLVFAYDKSDEGGGWNDFQGSFPRFTEAVIAAKNARSISELFTAAHIVDLRTGNTEWEK